MIHPLSCLVRNRFGILYFNPRRPCRPATRPGNPKDTPISACVSFGNLPLMLSCLVSAHQGGNPIPRLAQWIISMILSKREVRSLNLEPFSLEIEVIIADLEYLMDSSESPFQDRHAFNKLYRAMQSFRGAGEMFGFDDVAEIAQGVIRAVEPVRRQEAEFTDELLARVRDACVRIRGVIALPSVGQG